jgi:hypothetical protein
MPEKQNEKPPEIPYATKVYLEARRMEDILLIRRIKVAARLARKMGL